MTERVLNSSGFRLGASLLASCAVLAVALPTAAQAEINIPEITSTVTHVDWVDPVSGLVVAEFTAAPSEMDDAVGTSAATVSEPIELAAPEAPLLEEIPPVPPAEPANSLTPAEPQAPAEPPVEYSRAVATPALAAEVMQSPATAEVVPVSAIQAEPETASPAAVAVEELASEPSARDLFTLEKATAQPPSFPPVLPAGALAEMSVNAAEVGAPADATPQGSVTSNAEPEPRMPVPGSEWLKDLVEQVLERQPELAEAGAVQRQARARYRAAKAAALPQLNGGVSFGREVQDKHGRPAEVFGPQYSGNVGISVPLFNQTVVARARQARIQELAVDWQSVTARDRLVMRTVELYAELVRQSRLLELARENLAVHRKYVGQMKEVARKDLGRAADLPLAEARVSLAEAVLSSRLAKLEEVRVQWRALSGLPAPDEAPATPLFDVLRDLPDVTLPESLEVALQESVEWSPSLQKVLADQAATEASVDVARSAVLPRIDGGAQARGGKDYGSFQGRQGSWYVGASLQWDWGVGQVHERRAAREGAVAASSAVDVEMRRLKAGVESQWYEMLAAQASAKTYEGYVSQSEAVVRSYTEQFRIGRRSLLDVLNAENELFTARSNLTTARMDRQIAAWRLASLRGQAVEELGL